MLRDALALKDVQNFTTADITLSGGKLQVWGEWTTGVAYGAMKHFGYNHNTDAELDLNNNGGLMAITPDGSKLYVANGRSGTVSVIDAISNRKLRDIAVGELPWGVVIR